MFFEKTQLKKSIAVLTFAAFILSTISTNGFTITAPAAVVPPYATNAALTPDDLIVPFNLGRITSSVDYSTEKVVVQIQDLHAHAPTQRNIASILSILDKEYGIANVYVEGAPKGSLDTKWLADIADNSMKDVLTETMISNGELSGAEYYSVLSERTSLLRGIENLDIYIDNFLRLADIEKNKNSAGHLLSLMQAKIELLGQKYYSADNKKTLSLTGKYKNNKITSDKYYNALFKNAKKYGISLTKYPQIVSFMQMISLKKEIKNKSVQKEITKFLEHLQKTLSYSEYMAVVELSRSPETEGVFYLKLAQILQNSNDYNNYPNLGKFFAFIQINQKINPVELVRQEGLLINEIRGRSVKTLTEQDVLFMEQFASILGALLQNKITFAEYKNYNYSFADFKQTLNKYIIFNELNALESAVNTAEKFYAVNALRDSYFVEAVEGVFVKPSGNISAFEASQLNNAAGMLNKAKNIDVIITGGFHTDGVTKLLESKHQSYIVITPGITQDIAGSEKAYDSMIKRQTTMFNRNAFDAMKKSAVFEISPSVIDPAKAAFAVLFSEATIRKLYEDGMLQIKALESIINKGYGREAVKISNIEVATGSVRATVNGKNLIITNDGIMYEDEADALSSVAEADDTREIDREARESFTVQNALIDLMILSAKENISDQEVENAFNVLNPFALSKEVIDALKEIAQKFPEHQKEYLQTRIAQRENSDGVPALTLYPDRIEKIHSGLIQTAVKRAYSIIVAPFSEACDIMAISSYLILSKSELKDAMSEVKRKAEADADIEIARSEAAVSSKERKVIIKNKKEGAVKQEIKRIIETKLQKKSPRTDFLLSHSNFKGANMPVMAGALDRLIVNAASFSKVKPLAWAATVAGHMIYNITNPHKELKKDKSSPGRTTSVYELMKDNGLGAIYDGIGTSFGVYSANAEKIELCLFDENGNETRTDMTKDENTNVWNIYLSEVKPGQRYGFRAYGLYDPDNGHYFNPNKLAVDPYSFQQESRFIFDDVLRISERGNVYNMDTRDSAPFVPKSIVVDLRKLDEFETTKPPVFDPSKSRIYELHVGGFTALKEDLPQAERGTLKGLASPDIIEHLSRIGINTVEVQPIQSDANDPYSYERGLRNNSGYQTVTFFALNPELGDPSKPLEDLLALKETIGKLSAAGIKFGMDVVDNHSGEGSADNDPSLCYRLLDNSTYYLLNPNSKAGYDDASGCGNAFNTNNPVVLNMMTKYKEMYALMGVRLFRHDLMAAAARNEYTGEFDPGIEYMQIFQNSKILSDIDKEEGILVAAEGYMASGGARGVNTYHTDNFHKEISTWDSGTREAIRNFIMGRGGAQALGSAIADPNYRGNQFRQPHVYYMASHDGHPYAQLMAVYGKDNSDNREGGPDSGGGPNEYGMGLGYGNERIPMYVASAMTILSFCQGPIMFEMGDEFLRTQHGNNNPYNQNNEYLNMRWDYEPPLAKYMNALIKYRSGHLTLDASRGDNFSGRIVNNNGDKDITWLHPEGREMASHDWSNSHLGFMVSGDRLRGEGIYDDDTLVLMNMSNNPIDWHLPDSAGKGPWYVYSSTIDLELSNHGNEVYGSKYLVMPGEAVILYKPRSIGSRTQQTITKARNANFNMAMTASYPDFIENVKFVPLKTALRIIYSVFGAPAAEMNEMMTIVSGKMTQQDFLEQHRSYVKGNKIVRWVMAKGLVVMIGATAAVGGVTWLGKTINYTLHILHNVLAAVAYIFTLSFVNTFLTSFKHSADKTGETVKNVITRITAKKYTKKLAGAPYIINTDKYDAQVRERVEILRNAGIKVVVIAKSADNNMIAETPVRDGSFGFPVAKAELAPNAGIYFLDILGNASAADIFDVLSNNGDKRVIFEERIAKGMPGTVPVRYAGNVIAVDPSNPVGENIEIALQTAKTEYRVSAVKKRPVNMDYVFIDELTTSETVKNRVSESVDRNFDAIVVPGTIDTEILKLLIAESSAVNIRVMLTHEFTNIDMANELVNLQNKLSASRVWLDDNEFTGVEGVILQFEKVDIANTASVQSVENTVKNVQAALNRLTRSGYVGVQLDRNNKITEFDFKNSDVTNIILSDINDKRTYPANASVLFYLDKNSISSDSIAPVDITNIMTRFENVQTIIMPGWLIDLGKNSNAGFNPVEFLRARLGMKSSIAATLGEALNKGRVDAIGKGYYLEGETVNALYKALISVRTGEPVDPALLENVLNTTVQHKSLSGKIINTKLAESPIIKGPLLQALKNYHDGEQGTIALRQFEGIIQGILETTEFKMHIKKEYSNMDDFENYALVLVEARLACIAGGIEIAESDTSEGVPYFTALERLAGVKIEGFGYNKNGESNLPVREHINVLFGVINSSETEPQDRTLALADLLNLLALGASEIKITDFFTNRTEVQNIHAILASA